MSGEDETTHLPASLQKFFKVTLGMEWPEGSEGGLRAISRAWADFADALDDAASDVTVSSADIAEALRGVTGAAIVDFMRGDLHTSLNQLRDQSKEFSKTAKNAAADIQKTKIMLIAMAAMALATVISLIASLFGAFLVPGVLAAARVGLGALLRELVAKVGQLTLKQVLTKLPNLIGRFALDVGKYAAGGAAIMSGLDLSIQAGQNASGGRDGIDWNSVKNMAIGGAIGGAGAGVVGGLGRGAANFTKSATKNLSNETRDKVRTVVGGFGDLAHAGGQMAVVVPTNVLTNYATGGVGSGLDGILGAAGGRGGGGKHAGGGEHGGGAGGPSGLTDGFTGRLDGLGVDGGDRPVTGPDGGPVGRVFTQGGDRPATESGPPVVRSVDRSQAAPTPLPASSLPASSLPASSLPVTDDGRAGGDPTGTDEAAGPPASTVQQDVRDTPGDANAETTTPSRPQVQQGSTGEAPATGNQEMPTQGAPAPDTREGGPNAPETVGGGDRGGPAGDAPAVGSRIGGLDGASSANSEGLPAPVENDRGAVGGDRPAAGVQEGGAQERPTPAVAGEGPRRQDAPDAPRDQGTPAPVTDGRGATTDGGPADTRGPDAPAERGTTPLPDASLAGIRPDAASPGDPGPADGGADQSRPSVDPAPEAGVVRGDDSGTTAPAAPERVTAPDAGGVRGDDTGTTAPSTPERPAAPDAGGVRGDDTGTTAPASPERVTAPDAGVVRGDDTGTTAPSTPERATTPDAGGVRGDDNGTSAPVTPERATAPEAPARSDDAPSRDHTPVPTTGTLGPGVGTPAPSAHLGQAATNGGDEASSPASPPVLGSQGPGTAALAQVNPPAHPASSVPTPDVPAATRPVVNDGVVNGAVVNGSVANGAASNGAASNGAGVSQPVPSHSQSAPSQSAPSQSAPGQLSPSQPAPSAVGARPAGMAPPPATLGAAGPLSTTPSSGPSPSGAPDTAGSRPSPQPATSSALPPQPVPPAPAPSGPGASTPRPGPSGEPVTTTSSGARTGPDGTGRPNAGLPVVTPDSRAQGIDTTAAERAARAGRARGEDATSPPPPAMLLAPDGPPPPPPPPPGPRPGAASQAGPVLRGSALPQIQSGLAAGIGAHLGGAAGNGRVRVGPHVVDLGAVNHHLDALAAHLRSTGIDVPRLRIPAEAIVNLDRETFATHFGLQNALQDPDLTAADLGGRSPDAIRSEILDPDFMRALQHPGSSAARRLNALFETVQPAHENRTGVPRDTVLDSVRTNPARTINGHILINVDEVDGVSSTVAGRPDAAAHLLVHEGLHLNSVGSEHTFAAHDGQGGVYSANHNPDEAVTETLARAVTDSLTTDRPPRYNEFPDGSGRRYQPELDGLGRELRRTGDPDAAFHAMLQEYFGPARPGTPARDTALEPDAGPPDSRGRIDDHLPNTDTLAGPAHPVPGPGPQHPWIVPGATSTGHITFDVRDVESRPIIAVDDGGARRTVGVSFNGNRDYERTPVGSMQELRTVHRSLPGTTIDQTTDFSAHDVPSDLRAPAPWSADPHGPVLIEAHGTPDGFRVDLPAGTRLPDGTTLAAKTPVTVNGADYLTVTRHATAFQEAHHGNRDGSYALLSCSVASGPAAKAFADAVQARPDTARPVHAPQDTLTTLFRGSQMEMGVSNNKPWVTFDGGRDGRPRPETTIPDGRIEEMSRREPAHAPSGDTQILSSSQDAPPPRTGPGAPIRPPQATAPHRVRFDEGSKALDPRAQRELREVARDLRRQIVDARAAGRPLPHVEIVGDGHGRRLPGTGEPHRRHDTGLERATAVAVFLREQLGDHVHDVVTSVRSAADGLDGPAPAAQRGASVQVHHPMPRTVMGDPHGFGLRPVPRDVHISGLGGPLDTPTRETIVNARRASPESIVLWTDGDRLTAIDHRFLTQHGVEIRDVSTLPGPLPDGPPRSPRVDAVVKWQVMHEHGGIWADHGVDLSRADLSEALRPMPTGARDGVPLLPLLVEHEGQVVTGPGEGIVVAPPGQPFVRDLLTSDPGDLARPGFVAEQLGRFHDPARPSLEAGFRSGRYDLDPGAMAPWRGETPGPAPARFLEVPRHLTPDTRTALHDAVTAMLPPTTKEIAGLAALVDTVAGDPAVATGNTAPYRVTVDGKTYEVGVQIAHDRGPLPAGGPATTPELFSRGARSDTAASGRASTNRLRIAGDATPAWVPVGAGVSRASRDRSARKDSTTIYQERSLTADPVAARDVPVRVAVTVRDANGAMREHRTLDGEATTWHVPIRSGEPTGGAVTPAAATALARAVPQHITVDPAMPAKLLALLHPDTVSMRAPGRSGITGFFTGSNLKDSWPHLLTGGVLTDVLLSRGTGHAALVEFALQPRWRSSAGEVGGQLSFVHRLEHETQAQTQSELTLGADVTGGYGSGVPGAVAALTGSLDATGYRTTQTNHLVMTRTITTVTGAHQHEHLELALVARVLGGARDGSDLTVEGGVEASVLLHPVTPTPSPPVALPAHFSSGIGMATVADLGDAPRALRSQDEQLVRSVRGEVPPTSHRTRDVVRAAEVRRAQEAWNSPAHLGMSMNDLIDGGTHHSHHLRGADGRDYRMDVHTHAEVANLEHQGTLPATTPKLTSGARDKVSTTSGSRWGAGLTGAVGPRVRALHATLSFLVRATLRVQASADTAVGHETLTQRTFQSAQDVHAFTGDVAFHRTVTLTELSGGREVRTLPPPEVVHDRITLHVPAGELQHAPPPPGPEAGRPAGPGAHTQVLGTGAGAALRSAATDLLGGEGAFARRDGHDQTAVARLTSPTALNNTPGFWTRTGMTEMLSDGSTLTVTLAPGRATVVDVLGGAEWKPPQDTVGGGHKVTSTEQRDVVAGVGVVGTAGPPTHPASDGMDGSQAVGTGQVTAGHNRQWGRGTTDAAGAVSEQTSQSGSGRTYRLRGDTIATITHTPAPAGRSWFGSAPEQAPRTRQVERRGGLHLLADETQVRDWGLLPPELPAPPHPAPPLHLPPGAGPEHLLGGPSTIAGPGALHEAYSALVEEFESLHRGTLPDTQLDAVLRSLRGRTPSDLEGLAAGMTGTGLSLGSAWRDTFGHGAGVATVRIEPAGAPVVSHVEHTGTDPRNTVTTTRSHGESTTSGRTWLVGATAGVGVRTYDGGGANHSQVPGVAGTYSRARTGKVGAEHVVQTIDVVTVRGPVATVAAPVRMSLSVTRDERPLAGPAPRPVTLDVRLPADDLAGTPSRQTAPEPAAPTRVAAPDPAAWRSGHRDLSGAEVTVHVGPDLPALHQGLTTTLRDAGVGPAFTRPGPAAHALTTLFTPAIVDGHAAAMFGPGGMTLPKVFDPGNPRAHVTVTVHARTGAAHTTRIAPTMDITHGDRHSASSSTEFGASSTKDAGAGPVASGRSEGAPFGSGTAEGGRGGAADSTVGPPSGTARPDEIVATGPARLTGPVTDYLVVAEVHGTASSHTVAFTLDGRRGLRLRAPESTASTLFGPLPEGVRRAADALKAAQDTWRAAEQALADVHHARDDLWRAAPAPLRPDLAATESAVAARGRGPDAPWPALADVLDARAGALNSRDAARSAWEQAKTALDRAVEREPTLTAAPAHPAPAPRPAGSVGPFRPAPPVEPPVAPHWPAHPGDQATPLEHRVCKSDPVDVVTGEMVLEETDLPGLRRTHVSSYRAGRLFGATWASTLDQRLELDARGVCFLTEDGMALVYPHPEPDGQSLPEAGPRWPLRILPGGGYVVRCDDRELRFAGGAATLPVVELRDDTGLLTVTRDASGTPVSVQRTGGERVPVRCEDGRVVALGTEFAFAYDARGRLVHVVNGSGLPAVFDYDDAGRITGWRDRASHWYRYVYDADGRCVRTAGEGGFLDGRFHYDRKRRTTTYTDALGHVTVTEFDEAGRVVRETDPLGGVTTGPLPVAAPLGDGDLTGRVVPPRPEGGTRSHDGEGNEIEHVDALGRVTRHEYGAFGMRTATVDPAGRRTEYGYDRELRLVSVTAPGGLEWTYTHDAAGRLAAQTDFDGRTTTFTHDAAGRLLRTVDAAGGVTEFGYDAQGHLVRRATADGVTTFGYDAAGRLVEAVAPDSTLRIERDDAGRVVAQETDGRTIRFTYHDDVRCVERCTPAGVASAWLDGDLVTGGHEIAFDIDDAGRETGRRVDGVPVLHQAWGAGGELTAQDVAGPRPHRRSFAHFPDGRLAAVLDEATGLTGYTLDALGRVTEVAGEHPERHAYDELGNLAGDRGYAGTRLLRSGPAEYTYDALGRCTGRRGPDGHQVHGWDALGRLTSLTTPDGRRWRYRYDPLGRRTAKECAESGERVLFTWDGTTLVEAEHIGADGSRHAVTWDHHPGTGAPVAQRGPDGFRVVVTDPVGTPVLLTDADGRVTWQARTSLWGASPDGPGGTPLRFPGQYLDAESGLHYNVYRYYDPAAARYLSPDPLGLEPAPNPVAYVGNPLHEADLLGLTGCSDRDRSRHRSRSRRPPNSGYDASAAQSTRSTRYVVVPRRSASPPPQRSAPPAPAPPPRIVTVAPPTQAPSPASSSRATYGPGQYGYRNTERRQLSQQYGFPMSGATHESEHTVSAEVWLRHSGATRGSNTEARRTEARAPAYYEVREAHRAHPGTGTGGPDVTGRVWGTERAGQGFSSADYRDHLARRLEDDDYAGAVQLNQLGYALNPAFRQTRGHTPEFRAADESFVRHVVHARPMQWATSASTSRTIPAPGPEQQAAMFLSREEAATGRRSSREREMEIYSYFLDRYNGVGGDAPLPTIERPRR